VAFDIGPAKANVVKIRIVLPKGQMMQISIHTQGVAMTGPLRTFASEKIELALERLAGSVKKIHLYLADSNGPNRGGIDKSCRVIVQIHKQESFVLMDSDTNLGAVIDRITDRLGVAVSRRLERVRNKRVKTDRWGLE